LLQDTREFPRLLINSAAGGACAAAGFSGVAVARPEREAAYPWLWGGPIAECFCVVRREGLFLHIVLPDHWAKTDLDRRIDGFDLLAGLERAGDGQIGHLFVLRKSRSKIHHHDVG